MSSNYETHSALSVADYVLKKSRDKGTELTPMQVIKLVYLCHGWMLGLYNRPLIDELVEAWRYGPVIKSLYGAVKRFKASPVEGVLSVGPEKFDSEEESIMDQVVDVYKNFTGPQLSQLTHQAGTPWSETWNTGGKCAGIENELIQKHFEQLTSSSSTQ